MGHLKDRFGALQLGAAVGGGTRPHVADFVVNIDLHTRTQHREYRRREVYARGAVVHPDHRRLWLEDWRRLVRNREVGGTGDGLRIRWID